MYFKLVNCGPAQTLLINLISSRKLICLSYNHAFIPRKLAMNSSTHNPIVETMLSHRSIRKFLDKPIDTETLEQLVQCGQAAASSSFIQAYSIIRVTDKESRQQIADAAGGQQWINETPEFLIYCADLKRIEHACVQQGAGSLQGHTEHFMAATVDVALMAQNVLLAAESMGMGGVFIGGIRNDPQLVSDLLGLPDQVYPVFGMCLGWPAIDPDVKPRFPVKTILHQDHYQTDKVEAEVKNYDSQMRAYYQSRSGTNRVSDWSTQTAQAIQDKKREHMLEFLNRRGLLLR